MNTGSYSTIIELSIDKVWWSWFRIQALADRIERDGIPTVRDRDGVRDVIAIVSPKKREYLYRRLWPLYSTGTIEYLFGTEYRPGQTTLFPEMAGYPGELP